MGKSIVLLDLFAGFGGAELSAKEAGRKIKKSYISEVNPSALKVLKHHYPNAIFVGDVRLLKAKDFLDVTHITAGSPCQSFSMMGKRKGMKTTTDVEVTSLSLYKKLKREGFKFEGQSYLYFEFLRLLTEIRQLQKKKGLPVAKFLLENVKMDEKWEKIITKSLGVEPYKLDASDVSAQCRYRLFWTDFDCDIKSIPKLDIKLGDVIPEAVTGVGFRGRKLRNDKKYSYPKTRNQFNKSNCLLTSLGSITKNGKHYGTGFIEDKKGNVRLLTIEEAEILQGLKPGYTNVENISRTARIKMVGNGWPIPLTKYFFKFTNKKKVKNNG